MLELTVSGPHGCCSADLKLEEAAKHLVIPQVYGGTSFHDRLGVYCPFHVSVHQDLIHPITSLQLETSSQKGRLRRVH